MLSILLMESWKPYELDTIVDQYLRAIGHRMIRKIALFTSLVLIFTIPWETAITISTWVH